jgi:quinolinate synthase
MKRTSLEDVYDALNEKKYEIIISPEISKRAVSALNKMITYL